MGWIQNKIGKFVLLNAHFIFLTEFLFEKNIDFILFDE